MTDRISTKSKYAISGRVFGKRKTSQELQSDILKKERISGSISSTEGEESVVNTTEKYKNPSTSKMDKDETFVENMVTAITDSRVMDALTAAINKLTENSIKEVKEKIEIIEVENVDRDNRVEKLELQMDEYQQKDREKNIIIAGLPEEEMNKAGITEVINTKLGCGIKQSDIEYVMKIKKREGQTANATVNRARVVFKDKEIKMNIFKAKKKLKGNQVIWISDDLTLLRNNIAFLARGAVKEKKAVQTWTYDGKVFLKIKEGEKPIRIRHPEDIPT